MKRPTPPDLPGPVPFPLYERRVNTEDRRKSDADPMPELRALAATVRQCQRNGHADLTIHLDALLKKLGA